MKKVLVTGGAGFVGSHLCEALVKSGKYQVFSLDNYFTGKRENHIEGVKYIEGNTKDVFELIDFTPNIVYHLGEYSRVEQSFDDIDKVFSFNIQGTQKIIEFCRKKDAKLIYAGSSTKFSDGELGKNQSPYAWSKSTNTELIKNYGNWYGLSYAIVYFYNVYGEREIKTGKYATLIAIFCEKFKNNEPLPVVLPGTQKRNFTHVSDIVSGLILVGEKGQGDEYGIGSDKAYSISEIAQMFGTKTVDLPPRRGNRMHSEMICEKTKQLGWKAQKDIKQYIDKIIRSNSK